VHSVMGQTLHAIVTRVTSERENRVFRLWMQSQVVVILSRTNFAADIYFVGDAKKTSEALAAILLKRSQYDELQSHIINVLSGRTLTQDQQHDPPVVVAPPIIDAPKFYPFRMCDLDLPSDDSGFVYLLISLRDRKTTYIGQTQRLAKRLAAHNQAYGAKQTADPTLKPWAIYGVICGFKRDRNEMRRVESNWVFEREHRRNQVGAGNLTPQDVFDIGCAMLTKPNNIRHAYRIIQCCKR
jgi:GIY-YIG catalytic domain